MNDLVKMENGVAMVSSDLVAKKFGKVHRDVMRAIRNMECSHEFLTRNFAQSTYEVRGKDYACYNMTRDGFSFLCMGFTGKDAAKWKESYINAFNEMEAALNSDSRLEDRINAIATEGSKLAEAGSEWGRIGANLRKKKAEHKEKSQALISEVQMGMDFGITTKLKEQAQ